MTSSPLPRFPGGPRLVPCLGISRCCPVMARVAEIPAMAGRRLPPGGVEGAEGIVRATGERGRDPKGFGKPAGAAETNGLGRLAQGAGCRTERPELAGISRCHGEYQGFYGRPRQGAPRSRLHGLRHGFLVYRRAPRQPDSMCRKMDKASQEAQKCLNSAIHGCLHWFSFRC